ncbi:MAG: hypothetical protein K2J82_11295 [Muribaculaceae bacterium]|nr:hypothetical protein [Muribaculaceae bacterium]MDE6755181.1 hypothetical protein [Muribaculaceae bacterium]
MIFDECNERVLTQFLNQHTPDEFFSDKFLILYDFAMDIQNSNSLPGDLYIKLLPYYTNCIHTACIKRNRNAILVADEFHTSLFLKKELIIKTIGYNQYNSLIAFYIKTLKEMISIDKSIQFPWIPFYNTIIAIEETTIEIICKEVVADNNVLLPFATYLSVLLLEQKDNIISESVDSLYTKSRLWNFCENTPDVFYWNQSVRNCFDLIINNDFAFILTNSLKPILIDKLGFSLSELVLEKIYTNIRSGLFEKRKKEYINNFRRGENDNKYWTSTFT